MSINNCSALSSNAEFVVSNKNIKIFGLSNINYDYETHYLIYKIVNINNDKSYIGQHKTKNPFDNYMGSGHYLEHAMAKDGMSAFVKVILEDYDNFEQMNRREKELVQLSCCFPANPNSYNLVEGGSGQLTEEIRKKISNTIKRNGSVSGKNNPMYGYKWSAAQRKHQSEVMKGRPVSEEVRQACRERCSGAGNPMYGKRHSLESRMKMSEFKKRNKSAAGERNPMYQLRCMTEEQKIEWKRKISIGNKGKKCSEERKHKMSEMAKILHPRKMYNPETGKNITVPQAEVEKYLRLGFVMGTNIKSMLGKVGACAGKRIMTSPDGIKRYIKIEDIQKYIELGWK